MTQPANQQCQSTEGTHKKTKPIQQNTKIHSKLKNTDNTNKTKTQVRSPPTTSSLETEWDYSGRKEKDGQKKRIGIANERKGKVKGGKDEEVNGQGGRGVPRPHAGFSRVEPQQII